MELKSSTVEHAWSNCYTLQIRNSFFAPAGTDNHSELNGVQERDHSSTSAQTGTGTSSDRANVTGFRERPGEGDIQQRRLRFESFFLLFSSFFFLRLRFTSDPLPSDVTQRVA